jgi:hypothetical protein
MMEDSDASVIERVRAGAKEAFGVRMNTLPHPIQFAGRLPMCGAAWATPGILWPTDLPPRPLLSDQQAMVFMNPVNRKDSFS